MEEDRLVLLEQTDCGGNFPRDFAIFEEYLVCINERSGTVSVMRLEEGKPVLTDIHLEISTPLCVTGILL